MNSETKHTHSSAEAISGDTQPTSMTDDKVARRRLLMSGLSGGAALIAAASPIKALAGTSTCSTQQCSISGMKSANHSFKPGECADPCGGYSPGWWGQNWKTDKVTPRRAWPIDPNIRVKSLLRHSSVSDTLSLFELMGNSQYSRRKERHWICAYLNAFAPPPGFKFPYTPQEVLDFYNGTGRYPASEALEFFKKHMEGLKP